MTKCDVMCWVESCDRKRTLGENFKKSELSMGFH